MGLWCVEKGTNRIADYSDDGSIQYDTKGFTMVTGPTVGTAWTQYVYDGTTFSLKPADPVVAKRATLMTRLDAVIADALIPQKVRDMAQAFKDTL